MLEFFNVPREHGDCVVLLLAHPGPNLLGRYFPPSRVNDLLVADVSRTRQSTYEDVLMMGADELYDMEDQESYDLMDLASFLEYVFKSPNSNIHLHTRSRFGIQATHCLETLHK
jgi:hypothetical protein